MTGPERVTVAESWLAWHMGKLAHGRDAVAVGAELLSLYSEMARACLTLERVERDLGECWEQSQMPVPTDVETILACWQDGLGHPNADLETRTAFVGALYILCVKGRVDRGQALALREAWQRAAHPTQLVLLSAPGGAA